MKELGQADNVGKWKVYQILFDCHNNIEVCFSYNSNYQLFDEFLTWEIGGKIKTM